MNILRRVSSTFGALFPPDIVLLAVLEADPMKFSIKRQVFCLSKIQS
jgi:hypothetical protein